MADNFNLRAFLTENKLTKNAKLLKEEVSLNGKPVDVSSIEIDNIDMDDFPDFVDAYIVAADYEDGTPLTDEELEQFQEENYDLVGELIHDNQLYLQEKKEEMEVPKNPEDYTKQPGYIHETLTAKEKRLVEMVQDALGIQKEGYHDSDDLEDNVSNDAAYEKAFNTIDTSEISSEPLPTYENIEKLMQEIEHGTNKASHEYKMKRMKEIAEMLEAKVGSLEEGEGADFVDAKKVKQMKKDIMTLRKQAEKLEKEYDKKFAKKEAKKEEK